MRILILLLILEGAFLPTTINSIRGYKTWAFVSPFISRDEFMTIRLPGWWEAVKYINDETPLETVVLTYDHSVSYNVNRKLIFVDEPKMKEIHTINDIDKTILTLKQFNISYVLDVRYYNNVYVLQNRSYFYTFLGDTKYFDLVFNKGQVFIFRVL